MSNIIDMASFEHLRRSTSSERYRCPKTNILFPSIYKVLIPDCELVEDQPVFISTFSTEYRLKEPTDTFLLPDFPPLTSTRVITLSTEDDIYLDVIHFTNRDKALGFRQACLHLGLDPEYVRSTQDKQGTFILLARNDCPKKSGHIIYRCNGFQYIEGLGAEMECEYVAAFDSSGNIVTLIDIETTKN